MKNTGILQVLLLTGCLTLAVCLSPAGGEEAWRAEFDEACAQTNGAMAFTVSELNALVAKCDRLQKVIETEDETVRKVYLKRLQMCRNLYRFVLEAKKQEQQQK